MNTDFENLKAEGLLDRKGSERDSRALCTHFNDEFFDLKIKLYGIYYYVGDEKMISDVFLATSTKDAFLAFNQLVEQYKSKSAPVDFLSNVSLVALEPYGCEAKELCSADDLSSMFKIVDFVKES